MEDIKNFTFKLDSAGSISDIFELVKDAVWKTKNTGRAGLSLGLADLSVGWDSWIGAFHQIGSNLIVMNKAPIRGIYASDLDLYKPYVFTVLLHEYIHSLGYVDEALTRTIVYDICRELFGEEHVSTRMSLDMGHFFPKLTYGPEDYQLEETIKIELIRDFDRSSTEYIM
ncbi:MAG: hypothetical protein V3R86_00065 [Candidatus Hydrothermarchaeaceae archaeon]